MEYIKKSKFKYQENIIKINNNKYKIFQNTDNNKWYLIDLLDDNCITIEKTKKLCIDQAILENK